MKAWSSRHDGPRPVAIEPVRDEVTALTALAPVWGGDVWPLAGRKYVYQVRASRLSSWLNMNVL